MLTFIPIFTKNSCIAGAAYLDLPGDMLNGHTKEADVEYSRPLPPPPVSLAPEAQVSRAVELLAKAERPLVVVGKGAAYARAEHNVQELIRLTDLPYLVMTLKSG